TQELSKIRGAKLAHQRKPKTLSMLYPVAEGAHGLKSALAELCRQATVAIEDNHSVIVLSDRGMTQELAPIPALLATSAVHHHLVRAGTRMKTGIIMQTGEAREVDQLCLLPGYGSTAVTP